MWEKPTKLIPKSAGTPNKSEIVFVSPTGEEIRNKRQLASYLKSHPGGPSASQFNWSTGETPRRSARITEKAKASESLEEPPHKRPKKSSSNDISDEKAVTQEEVPEEAQGNEIGHTIDGTKQNVGDEKTDDSHKIGGLENVVDEITMKENSAYFDPKEKIPGNGERDEEPQKEHPVLEDTNKSLPAEGEPEDNLLVKEKVQQRKDAEGAGGEVLDKYEKQNGDSEKKVVTANKLGENAEQKEKEYSFDEDVARKNHGPTVESVKVLGTNGAIGDINNKETDAKNPYDATVASSAPEL